MIQTEEDEVSNMNKLLIKGSNIGGFKYIPFAAYNCMQAGQKASILTMVSNFQMKYRSISLEGFQDYNEDVYMHTKGKDEMETDNPGEKKLESTTISEYLLTQVKAANGENLFIYIYPTSDEGIREAICKAANFSDANEFASVVTSELCRSMNKKSARLAFQDPLEAIKGMKKDPWTPWAGAMDIVDTIVNTGNYKKRIRLDNNENDDKGAVYNNNVPKSVVKSITSVDNESISYNSSNGQQKSYTSVVTQSNGKRMVTPTTIPTNVVPTTPNVQVIYKEKVEPNLEVEALKKTVSQLEAQMVRLHQMEVDIRDVAHGVVNMGDTMTINNEVLKRSITADIQVNMETNTMLNNDSLIDRMSQLMNAQTFSIENRMDTKMTKTDEMLSNIKDSMDKKMEKTIKNLMRMINSKDQLKKGTIKHQIKTRVSRSLS
jgi:hypothetical protein